MTMMQPTSHVSDNACLLQAQNLSAKLGQHLALDGVSIGLPRGQWWAVVGPNGAGKSTLLRCLAGLHAFVDGAVTWHLRGVDRGVENGVAYDAEHDALPRKGPAPGSFAWLGQDSLADDTMRVHDVVALGRLPHQRWLGWATPSQADGQAVAQALADTDMAWAQDRRMAELSGGERQRVHVARTLAVQAPLLLLDEPFTHLDAPHQRRLVQVLRRQASQGGGILSVLHELPWALCADGLIVMQAGRVVAQGSRDDASVHRAMEAVFDHAIRIEKMHAQWAVLPTL
jgi:iron complex transport system ATP-binding protein